MEKEIIKQGEIMYKRIFGKKLGFCSIKVGIEEVELQFDNTEKLKKLKIGDKIKVTGYLKDDKIIELIIVKDIELIKSSHFEINLKKLREYKDVKKEIKSICREFKEKGKCLKEKCEYRHEYFKGEKEKIEKQKEKQKFMYQLSHEKDEKDENKLLKSKRNKIVSEFIIETFGIERLKKGHILDIAGGKGLISYYLSKDYKLNCYVIDPRSTKLPKKELKELKDLNMKTIQKEFNEDLIDLIKGASLIFGLHPDQASDSIVNISLKYSKNFFIIPCCVFPNLFQRKLKNGKQVIDYTEYIEYLKENIKDYKMKYLNFQGRNQVIYKIFDE